MGSIVRRDTGESYQAFLSRLANTLLKKAVEWRIMEQMPCTIRLLKVPPSSAGFYDFDEYQRFITSATVWGPATYLIMLLGGDAGLRCGEIIALEWRDVDAAKRQLCVRQSEWRGP